MFSPCISKHPPRVCPRFAGSEAFLLEGHGFLRSSCTARGMHASGPSVQCDTTDMHTQQNPAAAYRPARRTGTASAAGSRPHWYDQRRRTYCRRRFGSGLVAALALPAPPLPAPVCAGRLAEPDAVEAGGAAAMFCATSAPVSESTST